jgi:hypothetical protein
VREPTVKKLQKIKVRYLEHPFDEQGALIEVTNEVMPTRAERIDEMMQPGPEEPIFMMNL